MQLVEGGFDQVVFVAERDDEVDFIRFVVRDAEVGESTGLMVLVYAAEGG